MAEEIKGLSAILDSPHVYRGIDGNVAGVGWLEWVPGSMAEPLVMPDDPGRTAFLDLIEARIRMTEEAMSRQVEAAIFGPLDPNWKPTPVTRWRAFWRAWGWGGWRWRRATVREWIAVHVLRVDIYQGSGDGED